jgi:hypothetical protein
MKYCSNLVLATVLALGLTGLVAADPMPTAPTNPAPETAKTTNGALSDEQLGQMLETMGYEVKPGTYQSGARYFDVKLSGSKFEYHVRFSLSPNKRAVWLMVTIAEIPADVTAGQLRTVLEAINVKTGKMQFRVVGKMLNADLPLDNVAVTPVRLRYEITDLVATLDATADVWGFKKPETK